MNGCKQEGPADSLVDVWTVSGKCYLAGSTKPVAGVTVSCGAVDVSSASDGSYTIRGIASGDQLLTAHKLGLLDYSEKVHVDADMTLNVFMEFKRMSVSGYVANSIDGPISGARVNLGSYLDVTDISGRFEFYNIPRVAETLIVTHPNYNPSNFPLAARDSVELFDVTLTKDTVIEGSAISTLYVDQALPNKFFPVWPNIDRVYLRANGLDDQGVYKSGIQRNVFITFDLPSLLNEPSVVLVDGVLEICTDQEYPSFDVQTYAISSLPPFYVTYENQPNVGALLFSGSIANSAPGKYCTVLRVDGLQSLLARHRLNGQTSIIELRGGMVSPVGFYSVLAAANRPRLRYTVHY